MKKYNSNTAEKKLLDTKPLEILIAVLLNSLIILAAARIIKVFLMF